MGLAASGGGVGKSDTKGYGTKLDQRYARVKQKSANNHPRAARWGQSMPALAANASCNACVPARPCPCAITLV